jgi:hypothetical protein
MTVSAGVANAAASPSKIEVTLATAVPDGSLTVSVGAAGATALTVSTPLTSRSRRRRHEAIEAGAVGQ